MPGVENSRTTTNSGPAAVTGRDDWTAERDLFVVTEQRGGPAEDALADTGPLAREFAALTGALLASGSVAGGDLFNRGTSLDIKIDRIN